MVPSSELVAEVGITETRVSIFCFRRVHYTDIDGAAGHARNRCTMNYQLGLVDRNKPVVWLVKTFVFCTGIASIPFSRF